MALSYRSEIVEILSIVLPFTDLTMADAPDPPVSVLSTFIVSPTLYPDPESIILKLVTPPLDASSTVALIDPLSYIKST